MGSACYGCGEKFGRCYEHAGNCPDDCAFGRHDCPGDLGVGGDDFDVPTRRAVARRRRPMWAEE